MRTQTCARVSGCLLLLVSLELGCSAESPTDGAGGAAQVSGGAGSSGAPSAGAGGSATGGGTMNGGGSSGAAGSAGSAGNANGGAGGATAMGGSAGSAGQGGGSAGASGAAGAAGTGGQSGGCVPTKMWGTADPASAGPFEVLVEKDVGPENGAPDKLHDNMRPHFNVYRPKASGPGLLSSGHHLGQRHERPARAQSPSLRRWLR